MDEDVFYSSAIPPRGQILLGTAIAFGFASFVIVTMRLVFRASQRKIGISDWCIGIAMEAYEPRMDHPANSPKLASLIHSVFDALCVIRFGYGRHETELPLTIRHAGTPLKLFWLNQILFKVTILFTKLSLFFVYRDLFAQVESLSIEVSRAANYITAIIVVCYYTAATFVSIFACVPVSKSWTPKKPGTCVNSKAFLYSTAAANILTSLLLISIPLPLLVQTKYRKREITQLICLILLGLVDTACSIVRLSFIATSATKAKDDTTWTLIPSTTAASIEMNIAIIAASLVVMRPCFSYIYSFFVTPTVVEPAGSTDYISSHSYAVSKYAASNSSKSYSKTAQLTADMELATRSASQERILVSRGEPS